LEAELEQLYNAEEMYWMQRGSERWILMGDANTHYFHTFANGRKRKTKICSLWSEDGTMTNQKEISRHIVQFYKNLFGSGVHRGMHLEPGFLSMEFTIRGSREDFPECSIFRKGIGFGCRSNEN
jgi:hypothetical protein